MKIVNPELINKIVGHYQDGYTARQAMYRGVGEQAQHLEKQMYWGVVSDTIDDYNKFSRDKISHKSYKKLFDDGTPLEFIAALADNVEFLASKEYNELSDMQIDSLILSRLLKYMLEVK
jgi:hypothetical protein